MPPDPGRETRAATVSRPDLDKTPDAVPKAETIIQAGPNKPYVANGTTYTPDLSNRPFQERGLASWYGEKYQGNRTSSGEVYDMNAMTGAHTTMPLPSYARVTHLGNGKSVVVRINDRGPFVAGRVIDLSYAAAYKLGLVNAGQAEVLVERVFAADAPVSPFPSSSPVAASNPPSSTQATTSMIPAPAVSTPVTPAPSSANSAPSSAATSAAPPLTTRPRVIAPPPGKGMMLQAGAFSSADNAQKMAIQIRNALPELADRTSVELATIKEKTLYRVVIGAFYSDVERSSAAVKIQRATGQTVSNR